jgi:DNA-directed RNA polymerase sigma subunit (sigma70/sigma32)
MKEIDARYNQLYERDATFEEMREELANLPVKTKYTTNPDILMAGMRADKYAMPLELRNGDDADLISAPISWLQAEDDSLEVLEKTDSEFLANLLLTALNPTERHVVMARLGKKSGFQLSFAEISEDFGKTPEWARSIFNKAIKKMQIRAKRSKVVKDHLK